MTAGLSAALPLLFLFICLPGFAAMLPLRAAALKSAIVFGVVVVVNTELLSLATLISPLPVALAWAAESAIAAALAVRWRLAIREYLGGLRFPRLGGAGWAAALAIAFIVAATGVTAIVAPPNTYDSMAFHMSRVAHWVADRSLAPYPTNIVRQLYESPWSEFAILQFQVLSGGDRLANIVQWLAMCGCVAGVSRIAMQLGAPPRGQVFAALVTATLPMGILQASSTQTDYVEAFWLVCVVSLTLEFLVAPDISGAAWLAAAVGLAALTKGTAFVFAAPLVVLLGGWTVLRLRRRVIAPAAVLIAIPLLLNIGQFVRNETVFASPLAEKAENQALVNQTYAPNAVLSNVVRDAVLQFGTPSTRVNNLLDRAVRGLHKYVLHTNVDDPRTTWPGVAFAVNPLSLDEDYAGDPLQALLAITAIALAIVFAFRGGPRLRGTYAACLVIAFVLFAAYLRWQPWHARLELPLLVLAAPLVGLYMARLRARGVAAAICGVLFLASLPWALDNASRPLVPYAIPLEARYLDGNRTIFDASRLEVYFAKRHDLLARYTEAVADARATGCTEIGLWTGAADWEYPLWVMAGDGARVDQIEVQNETAHLSRPGGEPCFLVVVMPDHPATIELNGKSFSLVSDQTGVALYEPA